MILGLNEYLGNRLKNKILPFTTPCWSLSTSRHNGSRVGFSFVADLEVHAVEHEVYAAAQREQICVVLPGPSLN